VAENIHVEKLLHPMCRIALQMLEGTCLDDDMAKRERRICDFVWLGSEQKAKAVRGVRKIR